MMRGKKVTNKPSKEFCTLNEALKDIRMKNQFYTWDCAGDLLAKDKDAKDEEGSQTIVMWMPKLSKFAMMVFRQKYQSEAHAFTENEFREKYKNLLNEKGKMVYFT